MKWSVGIAQFAPVLGSVERNLEKLEAYIDRAEREGLDLLVFPELALTGYTLKDLVPRVAQRLDSPIVRRLAEASRRLAIVCGFVEESEDYRFYNAAAYFAEGQVQHVHRKVYLPTYGMFEEYRYFAAGDRIRTFPTPFGRVGILICEDLWHPSTAYIAAQDGCELLIGLACSPARGVPEEGDLYSSQAWRTLNRMYAHFFSQYVIFANRVGFEDGIGFWGGSEVVSPEGTPVAVAPYYEETFLRAVISTAEVRRCRIISPFLRDERLDITLRELRRIEKERCRS
ncbi:MAG: carbon-nitrogen hydrolase [Candidatus Poribacteria bacterium]|nr:MAG: carbon-nitrogen hydrolase [Candidatus Poribacteria bacterium]